MKKISIIIIDDHAIIREAISSLLSRNENFEVLGQTDNAETVIKLVTEKQPDIALLDINMYPVDGFGMIKLIRKHSPQTGVIALSLHNHPTYVEKMFRLGAKGYLTKNSASEEMITAIIEVHRGNHFICAEVKNNSASQAPGGNPGQVNIEKLSQREVQVIQHLKEGQSSKQIAAVLKISQKTVEVHRYHILKKLNLHNTVSALNFLSSSAFNF